MGMLGRCGLLGGWLLLCSSLGAQLPDQTLRRHLQKLATDEAYARRWQQLNAAVVTAQAHPSAAKTANELRQVPVVFHIIYQSSPSLAEERILSQIRVLNEDYRKLTGTPGDGDGATMEVGFFLAQQDPEGNCHSGIVRITSGLAIHNANSDAAEASLKALSMWPPDRYLNIWVVDAFTDNNILGYASMPGEDPTLDGVVLGKDYVGVVSGSSSEFAMGRTGTHEVGHWLGLYHPFDEGCAGTTTATCAHAGDFVCDTPPMANPTYTCPGTPPNTCHESPDLPDPHHNYMDYLPDACMNRFTTGQATRARALMEAHRAALYSADNLALAGLGGECPVTGRLASTPEVQAQFCTLPDSWEIRLSNYPMATDLRAAILNPQGQTIWTGRFDAQGIARIVHTDWANGLYLAGIYTGGQYVILQKLPK
ncbi:MAG: zinc metalloprotease [Bacteroidetes bacterium]|nr:zinc metalloprotease [Bacteroidota bacterium]